MSIDPVLTDANTGGSFNRYVYANNNPYKNIDPDGRQARGIDINCTAGCATFGSLALASGGVGRQSGRSVGPASAGPAPTEGVESIFPEGYLIGAGGAGRIIVKGVLARGAAATEKIVIQFGKVENQVVHTFRHVKDAGLSPSAVQDAIKQDLIKVADSLPKGQYSRSVVVDGTKLEYSAFKLPDGTINVGRITPSRP